jgi:hypothetical protein
MLYLDIIPRTVASNGAIPVIAAPVTGNSGCSGGVTGGAIVSPLQARRSATHAIMVVAPVIDLRRNDIFDLVAKSFRSSAED